MPKTQLEKIDELVANMLNDIGSNPEIVALDPKMREILTRFAGTAMKAALVEYVEDVVEGIEADLEEAVKVAWSRGATDWTRLNYPDLYERFEKKNIAQTPR